MTSPSAQQPPPEQEQEYPAELPRWTPQAAMRLLLGGVFDLLASLLEVAFHLFGFALAF
jgi:hypothetical protein